MMRDVEPKNAIFEVSQFQKMGLIPFDREKSEGNRLLLKKFILLYPVLSYGHCPKFGLVIT